MKKLLTLLYFTSLALGASAQVEKLIPQVKEYTITTGTYTVPTTANLSQLVKIKTNAKLKKGAYKLDISRKGITLQSADAEGVNYGLSTLRQMLLYGNTLNCVSISDEPQFGYRGIMIDCSRHFWTIDELKKSINQMSLFKMNRLHLHLTDNQGWRFEVKKYPQIAEKGSYYWDYPALSGKYYTQEELKDLVAYAAARSIEIIPEIDMPGHMLSLFAAFPEITCLGGEYEAFPQERDGKYRKRTWQNMVCLGNPKTYEILEDIIEELCDVFPSRYIHLGGDEVSTKLWQDCPDCKALFEKEHMHGLGDLQDYFTHWAHDQLAKRDRVMLGWDEINARKAAADDDVITIWHSDNETLQNALNRNLKVIQCPGDPCYFDYSYAKNPTRKVYEWEPGNSDLIIGAQANLWTEYVCNQPEVEKMFYPRLCALAEVLWNNPSKKNWHDFYNRVHNFPFQKAGIHAWMEEKETDNWFNLETAPKPKLPEGVHVETNIYNVKGYDPEYALDGDLSTFFQNGWGTDSTEYFKVWYDEPQRLNKIRVICDRSKDYYQRAQLLISENDSTYTVAGESDDFGNFEITLDGRQVKAFKIVAAYARLSRLVIREIETEKYDFSVLNWNIWQEGTMIPGGYNAILDELERLKPDFVTFAEVRNYKDDFLQRVCNDLKTRGLEYYSFRSDDSGLLSHYPIQEHSTVYPLNNDHGSVYRLVAKLPNGKEVAVYCTHMDYLNDTYYEVRGYDGNNWKEMEPLTDVKEILRRNDLSERDEECAAFIEAAKADETKGRAVILAGDFNEPSFLDWTEETKNLVDHHGTVVPWPQSVSLYQAGFQDCFRAIYPNPVTHPGFTYPGDNPAATLKSLSWAPKSDERERIDLMYASPDLTVTSCRVFGPSGDIQFAQRVKGVNDEYVLLPKGLWPTDHKGLLTTFRFK